MNNKEKIAVLIGFVRNTDGEYLLSPEDTRTLAQALCDAGYVKLSPDQNLPELYSETFAEGMRLPDQNELQRYRNVLNWLIHECGWRRVEVDNG